jgi:C4-dicarboxylate-specific signal transduction histidine kinase
MLETLFDPFMNTKETGLGVDLPDSYGIVTAHGGSLTLRLPGE